jgi:hypothetical protein
MSSQRLQDVVISLHADDEEFTPWQLGAVM